MKKRPRATSLLQWLLGPVPEPRVAPDADYRDVADAVGAAVVEAARLEPARFFAVLAAEPALLDIHDVVWTLGYMKDARAVAPLIVALGSKHGTIRSAAANGLCQYRDASAVDPLVKALRDRSPSTRHRVVEALRRQASPRAIPALRDALTRPSNRKEPQLIDLIEETLKRLER